MASLINIPPDWQYKQQISPSNMKMDNYCDNLNTHAGYSDFYPNATGDRKLMNSQCTEHVSLSKPEIPQKQDKSLSKQSKQYMRKQAINKLRTMVNVCCKIEEDLGEEISVVLIIKQNHKKGAIFKYGGAGELLGQLDEERGITIPRTAQKITRYQVSTKERNGVDLDYSTSSSVTSDDASDTVIKQEPEDGAGDMKTELGSIPNVEEGDLPDIDEAAIDPAKEIQKWNESSQGDALTDPSSILEEKQCFLFYCQHCKKSFKRKSGLSIHCAKCHPAEKQFKCNGCGRSFAHAGARSSHMKTCTGETPHCEICLKIFRDRRSLRYHKTTHQRAYSCEFCTKSYNNEDALVRHTRTHTGIYECHMCQKTFSTSSYLSQHRKSHSEDRPCMCSECGHRCKNTADLKRHMLVHSDKRDFECTECGKSFKVRNALTVHAQIHTGERPYMCNHCGKTFRLKNNLKTHMFTHTGEKPLKCPECGKGFTVHGDLNNHKRIHTGEKPFKCTECHKRFREAGQLRVHMRTHTGEKPYSCPVCGHAFTTFQAMSKHSHKHSI